MRDMRKYKRFKLDLVDLSSKISLVGEVNIIDISPAGVKLTADRTLNIGKECLLMLKHEDAYVNVKGVVVRSELSRMEERTEGEQVTIYSLAISFKDEPTGRINAFLDSIEDSKKIYVPEQEGWFYRDIHFNITTPDEEVLKLPAQFGIKEISKSGIIIQNQEKLNIDSMVLMELSLSAYGAVNFMGKVVSCRMIQDAAPDHYDIGVEFPELTELDRLLLDQLIERVKEYEKYQGM